MNVLNSRKKQQKCPLQMSSTRSQQLFASGVFASKFLIIALLVWLAYIESVYSFCECPPRTVPVRMPPDGRLHRPGQSCSSLSCACSLASTCLNAALLGFLAFFVFQTLMEFAGVNQASSVSTLSELKAVIDTNVKWLLIPIGIVFTVLGVLALMVRDTSGFKNGRIGGYPQLFIEAAVLGLAAAIPVTVLAIDRGKTTESALPGAAQAALLFGALHLALQSGGFYGHVFKTAA